MRSLRDVLPLMHKAFQYIALLFSISLTDPAYVEILSSGVEANCANGISMEAIYPFFSRFVVIYLLLLTVGL